MKKVVFAFLILLLAGCSAMGIGGKKETRELTDVTCSGFVGWEACDAKAKAMCPKGYDVVMKDESLIAQRRTMRIACN